MRHFTAGQNGALNAIQWRIVEGRKKHGDLRLDIACPTWRAVPMSLGFLMADFFYENEDHLFPPPQFNGGKRYTWGCEGAVLLGWEAAVEQLQSERERKQAA